MSQTKRKAPLHDNPITPTILPMKKQKLIHERRDIYIGRRENPLLPAIAKCRLPSLPPGESQMPYILSVRRSLQNFILMSKSTLASEVKAARIHPDQPYYADFNHLPSAFKLKVEAYINGAKQRPLQSMLTEAFINLKRCDYIGVDPRGQFSTSWWAKKIFGPTYMEGNEDKIGVQPCQLQWRAAQSDQPDFTNIVANVLGAILDSEITINTLSLDLYWCWFPEALAITKTRLNDSTMAFSTLRCLVLHPPISVNMPLWSNALQGLFSCASGLIELTIRSDEINSTAFLTAFQEWAVPVLELLKVVGMTIKSAECLLGVLRHVGHNLQELVLDKVMLREASFDKGTLMKIGRICSSARNITFSRLLSVVPGPQQDARYTVIWHFIMQTSNPDTFVLPKTNHPLRFPPEMLLVQFKTREEVRDNLMGGKFVIEQFDPLATPTTQKQIGSIEPTARQHASQDGTGQSGGTTNLGVGPVHHPTSSVTTSSQTSSSTDREPQASN